MEKSRQLAFAEMLHTRFCHDMAGPISAVNNGLEFFVEENNKDVREQAIDLMRLSAQEAFSKLQMYRIAFGRANALTETSVEETREIAKGYFSHGKITLDWPQSPLDGFEERMSSEMRQLVVNLILQAASAMVYGGTLSVRRITTGDQSKVNVSGHFARGKLDAEALQILNNPASSIEFSPSNVPVFFLSFLADSLGTRIAAEQKDDSIQLSAGYL